MGVGGGRNVHRSSHYSSSYMYMPTPLTLLSKDSLLARERVATQAPELDMLHSTRDQLGGTGGVGIKLNIKYLQSNGIGTASKRSLDNRHYK